MHEEGVSWGGGRWGRRKEGLSQFVNRVLYPIGHSQEQEWSPCFGEEHGFWGSDDRLGCRPGSFTYKMQIIHISSCLSVETMESRLHLSSLN